MKNWKQNKAAAWHNGKITELGGMCKSVQPLSESKLAISSKAQVVRVLQPRILSPGKLPRGALGFRLGDIEALLES